MLYGFPGAGKTHFARQLATTISAAHVHGDRIRHELFENPRHDKREDDVIEQLMHYMSEEFLHAGLSVIYDTNAMRTTQRKDIREFTRKAGGTPVMIWLQIDQDSAKSRIDNRDKRKNDDKYAVDYDAKAFDSYAGHMQNPAIEDYIVISGKHTFNTQKSAVMKKLYDMGLVNTDTTTANLIKPGLVNLVPNPAAGRVDMSRRNISIK